MKTKSFGGGRGPLTQNLDKDVYQIIRKLSDESANWGGSKLTATLVYEKIKHSNSSLNRKSKKLLEDSIERVLESLEEEMEISDDLASIDGEFDGIEISESRPANDMNQSIVGMWATSAPRKEKEGTAGIADKKMTAEPSRSKKRSLNGEPPPKRRKEKSEIDHLPSKQVTFADFGGIGSTIRLLRTLTILPMRRPGLYAGSKVQPPRGILLYGPPGTGKTMLANAIAVELKLPFISISAPSIVAANSGDSEKALRGYFEQAVKLAPALMFIDEIDAIAPKRENTQREMEKRIVAQLLTCFDDLEDKAVIVLAATNRPDALDKALRRSGRFDREIGLNIPSETARERILRVLTKEILISDDVDLGQLAKQTAGFVGADLNNLVSTANEAALNRFIDSILAEAQDMDVDAESHLDVEVIQYRKLEKLASDPNMVFPDVIRIKNEDFVNAFSLVQSSLKREGFATIPETTWTDVGALADVREELVEAIVEPIRFPERRAHFGLTAPSGVLLWGPPGNGKTLLAKAVANESRANFISVNGPELLNKYVGESERAVRQVFSRARTCVPCLIFVDEIDAMVPRRDDTLSESKTGVVNTLLTELDGLGGRPGIYIIGATNRPDRIDPAILRPGRLETRLYVGLPGPEERVEILRTLTRDRPVEFNEAMESVARSCHGFSGADLGSLARKAASLGFKRGSGYLTADDFVRAAKVIKPSVEDIERYERLRKRWL